MFLLSQNDENQSENGSKNSKIRLRARPPAEPQKKMLQTKKLRSKSWKTRFFFHFSLADFGRARSRTGVFRTVFYSVFLKASVTTYQKQEVLAEKWDPPPGKPVTFYECHPDDHAPAPSVRADFSIVFSPSKSSQSLGISQRQVWWRQQLRAARNASLAKKNSKRAERLEETPTQAECREVGKSVVYGSVTLFNGLV